MKKRILIISFIAFFLVGGGLAYNFYHDPKPNEHLIETKIDKKDAANSKRERVVEQYQPIPISGPALWQNEAESLTSYPDNLDQISPKGELLMKYENHLYGYSFDFPSDWNIDHHQVPYYTRFFNENFRLDITVQNVDKAWTTSGGYISETLDSVSPLITENNSWQQGSFLIKNVDYTRNIIDGIENDMNMYSYYFITKNNYVYTFQLKSNQAEFQNRKKDLEALIKSFSTKAMADIDLNESIVTNIQTNDLILKQKKKTLLVPKNMFMMGIYTPNSYDIDSLETSIQQKIGLQMFYKPINSAFDPYTQELIDKNRVPIITFLYLEENSEQNVEVIRNILNGVYDQPLKKWAKQIKDTGAPILIRPGNEMNGIWSEWSYINNFNDPDLYKLSFTYIVNLFREAGALNAYFIWNPNHVSSPYYQWNEAALYYPGDKVVDFVGMTSYNFGNTKWNDYQSFDDLYEALYWDYSRSYYKKPLIIGELGSVEEGGNKAQWIQQMFNAIPTNYPNIKMAIWFDSTHPPYDLRINTSQPSLAAFQEGMNQSNVIKQLQKTK